MIRPGPLSYADAAQLNEVLLEIERLLAAFRPNVTAHGRGLASTIGGYTVDPDVGFWAEITHSADAQNRYTWRELEPRTGGTFATKLLGREGGPSSPVESSPAYEANGNADVLPGTVVWLQRGFQDHLRQEYIFERCCAGSPPPATADSVSLVDEFSRTVNSGGGYERSLSECLCFDDSIQKVSGSGTVLRMLAECMCAQDSLMKSYAASMLLLDCLCLLDSANRDSNALRLLQECFCLRDEHSAQVPVQTDCCSAPIAVTLVVSLSDIDPGTGLINSVPDAPSCLHAVEFNISYIGLVDGKHTWQGSSEECYPPQTVTFTMWCDGTTWYGMLDCEGTSAQGPAAVVECPFAWEFNLSVASSPCGEWNVTALVTSVVPV